MGRPSYLSKYLFNWEMLDLILGGKSALDTKFFIGKVTDKNQVYKFLKGYGLDPMEPVSNAEIFGNFQEALQFIKRFFLKEGNPNGLDLRIPNKFYTITDISELFLMAAPDAKNREERLWCEVVFKVMHTILHVDKDLRSSYFSEIQTQIFDRFYRNIHRDSNDQLFLGDKEGGDKNVPLVDFETKSKKSRESVIIKLLHKVENVAEELFDRVGVRFITKNRVDALRVVKFLVEKNMVVPHNVKPSRSVNTLLDVEKFQRKYKSLIRMGIRNDLSEDRFLQAMERIADESLCFSEDEIDDRRNDFSAKSYQAIQFTCRQLITYSNPFLQEFNKVKKLAKKQEKDSELVQSILKMDPSHIARDIRFFYPFEVQITDIDSHKENTLGRASHADYKKAQLKSAMGRLFNPMLRLKGMPEL